MSYHKCACQVCGSQYATMISTDLELQKESCPGCGAKQLKILGPMSFTEVNSLFYSGG